jgi:hypothetical protein
MQFIGIGLPCRPTSDPAAEIAVTLLDTRGTVLVVEWCTDLDRVAALVPGLASPDTVIAAGSPLCGLARDDGRRAAVRSLRRRLALADVDSGVLECDADSFPFPVDDLASIRPPRLCDHSGRAASRAVRLAEAADDLVRRVALLNSAQPPLDLWTNETTAALLTQPTPRDRAGLEHRAVLLSGLLCGWAASNWHSHPEEAPLAPFSLAV